MLFVQMKTVERLRSSAGKRDAIMCHQYKIRYVDTQTLWCSRLNFSLDTIYPATPQLVWEITTPAETKRTGVHFCKGAPFIPCSRETLVDGCQEIARAKKKSGQAFDKVPQVVKVQAEVDATQVGTCVVSAE